MTETMKRWQMNVIGRAHLTLQDAPVPSPKPGEVLVKVKAVSLNYRDKMVIETGRGLPLEFPFTPGSDLSGQVMAVGQGVGRFCLGDNVISSFTPDWVDGLRPGNAHFPAYRTLGGFYPGVLAQYVALPESWFVHAPKSLSPVSASTLPCAGLTAWFALCERGHVKPGDIVLVEGSGGVALFAIQIAKMQGATVIVSCSPQKFDCVRNLGADHVIDRHSQDLAHAVWDITHDYGADHILELVGGSHLGRAAEIAAVGGHIYLIGALQGFEVSSPLMPILMKDVTIHGIGTGHRLALERLVRAVDQSGLKPVIDRTFVLEDLPAALDHLDAGPLGKIVIEMPGDDGIWG
ncbi:zinc-dependent alcohol dehydrogenase family protein [Thalassospira marina]|nr:NAD(P)-dependent alcohol dehydrogenase [Thalassospira marina]